MIEALQVPLNSDLSQLTKWLWKLKISHRVFFKETQILVVDNQIDAEFVANLYQGWCESGEFSVELISRYTEFTGNRNKGKSTISFKGIPVVLLLLICSLVISAFVGFGDNQELLSHFTITNFQVSDNAVHYTTLQHNIETFEIWRFLSPIFIHFNITHLAFNGLWIWIIASVIERKQGSVTLLLITLFSGISSNIGQYLIDGPIFGGLSGVVYAVLTYAWLWDKIVMHNKYQQPTLNIVSNPLMTFMSVWLVLGYTDILTNLGFGEIANSAHLVGLICGALAVPSILLFQQVYQSKKT